MEALAFELTGKTAFFKKPDVNANVYFTYGQVPKIALLGILGAIVGCGGYHEQKRSIEEDGPTEENQFPEFYRKQQHLKVGIVPSGDRSYFTRKIQTFNNSVGYASGEAGNNLVVKEQWLENPHWTVYIVDDGLEAYQTLKEKMINRKTTFIPYLGKNDHPADIYSVRVVSLQSPSEAKRIDSLFQASDAELGSFLRLKKDKKEKGYYYKENLPYAMDKKLNSYLFKEMICTNRRVKIINSDVTLYEVEDRIIAFY